jgi:hypothetical protein
MLSISASGSPFIRRSASHDAARMASAARNLFALGRRSLEQGQRLPHRIHAPASDATGISGRTVTRLAAGAM